MTTNQVHPTWGRDLSVLSAIYKALETAEAVDAEGIMAAAGASRDEVWDAVDLWMKEGCLDQKVVRTAGPDVTVFRMNRTPAGMRLVGAWPTPEQMPTVFIAALQQVAQQATDVEERGWLRDMVDRWTGPEGAKALIEIFGHLVRQGWLPGN